MDPRMLSYEEAVRKLRADGEYSDLIRDSYLDVDVSEAARRFRASGEFAAILAAIGCPVEDRIVLDVGAGNGIASFAFATAGARHVIAVEPDSSSDVGAGAIAQLCRALPVSVVAGTGEALPLTDEAVDIVYARQVLHHSRNLEAFVSELSRVLRPHGVFAACREHVVDDDAQLLAFLQKHPLHRFTGQEGAYSLARYRSALTSAGLTVHRTLGPWETLINAFPIVRTEEELADCPRFLLVDRFGSIGAAAARIPGVAPLVWRHLRRPLPGRMFSFVAHKL